MTHFRRLIFLILVAGMSCTDREVALESCQPYLIEGYIDRISYYPGEKVTLFLRSAMHVDCQLTIYSVNDHVAISVPTAINVQATQNPHPSVDGYGYTPTVQLSLPLELRSGIYLVEQSIPLIVKPGGPVDIMVVYPSNTANAYEGSGGLSMYVTPNIRPTEVSFLRPQTLQADAAYCLKWLETTSYKIGYIADSDLELASILGSSKMLLVPGHSEYWTRKARRNFDDFILRGGHALILSGNTMWWQVRYSPAGDKLICYRDSLSDPEPDPLLKTINWNKPSLQYPILSSLCSDFSYGGFGQKADEGWDGWKIVLPESPLLTNTGLKKGDILPLASREMDGAPITGFDADGFPIINRQLLNVYKFELIGFDKGSRMDKQTVGTFMVFQRTAISGTIVHGASTDWCGLGGMGSTSPTRLQQITRNAIDLMLSGKSLFAK